MSEVTATAPELCVMVFVATVVVTVDVATVD